MTGTLLPAVSIRIENKQYPLSLRNALGSVMDYWDVRHKTNDQSSTKSVAEFLGQRFHRRTMLQGPLALATRAHTLPYQFAAFIHNERKCQFVIVLDDSALSNLPDIEKDIRDIFANNEDWGLRLENDQRVAEFRDTNGNLLRPEETSIIAVIPRTGTAPKRVRVPKTAARILSLPDFVTLYDSLEDFAELDRFWSYLDGVQNTLGPGLIGIPDLFATFRDSHGVLVEGAISPNLIFLDPHWGSNWRYRVLKDFWKTAPSLFPDDVYGGWIVEPVGDGIQRLISKSSYSLSWSTTIADCALHFVFSLDHPHIDELNGRMLELMVQCLADSLFQRKSTVENLPVFSRRRITTVCRANEATPAQEVSNDDVADPLFSHWRIIQSSNSSHTVNVSVNLARAQSKFIDPVDDRFEAECAKEWINGIEALLEEEFTGELAIHSDASSARLPRFTMTRRRRTIDAPDFASPDVPKPNQYKIARRDLALIFRGLNTSPRRYELAEAKAVIDPARDAFRVHIHDRIAKLDRRSLLIICIQQLDALTIEYLRAVSGFKQSMSHQVSYDRSDALADAYDRFVSNARNYRYLLEFCLSEQSTQLEPVTDRTVVELVASIDWLFVLYNASDVLHNDIDVAGVELDSSFVPKVFYSSDRDKIEKTFAHEMASAMLGFDLESEDEVNSPDKNDVIWQELDRAFFEDIGFAFTHLMQTFQLLSRWQTARRQFDLYFYYEASTSEIAEELTKAVDGLTTDEANRLVEFVTLQPLNIRRLLGKAQDESDVPVWEHTKRGSRYTIKPLVPVEANTLAWGAAAAERALGIWTRSVKNGYLAADFPWPRVQAVVREIKAGIERQLEIRAGEICARTTPFMEQGINFKHRFPRDKFDDVGDFDVLAYWPQSNTWLTVECKYNQPPHCLKDARRLRDNIFGILPKHGQFAKIERRREFLSSNLDHLRTLLRWPTSSTEQPASVCEIYVSRDIYWWMRNPPYEVPTHFVRIDALDGWLQTQGF